MHQFAKSKMVGTINGLSHDEYRLLGRWLKSPFFNTNKALIRFYEILKKYHPQYDQAACSKEKLFKKIFPGESYRAKLILTLMSELTKHVEEFLVHQQLKEDQGTRELLLKNSYLKRNQIDRYEKRIYNRIKKLETKNLLKRKELLELEQLYEELYFRPNRSTRYKPQQEALMKTNYYLDRYYALGKHRLLNEMTERQKAIKGDNGFSIDEDALSHLRENLQEKALDLYANRVIIELPEKETDYLKLKRQFLESFHLLELRDQKVLFITLVNIAVRLKVRIGKTKMLQEIYELYQLGLKHHWFLHNNQMTSITFCNIVVVSNATANYSFSEKFVGKYIPYLEYQLQEDAKTWALADIQYHLGNFKQTIDLLNSHKSTAHVFNLHGRILLLMAYFDLCQSDNSYDDFFNYYVLATEKFLRRDKLITKTKLDSLLKLLRYTNRLAISLFEQKADATFLSNIKEEIDLEENIGSKDWLLSKVEELKTKAAT